MQIDAAFVHGKVVTMDLRGTVADAVAVAHGRVLAVGRTDDVLDLAGPRTRVVDLQGRLLLPGFTDCHTHFHSYSLQESGQVLDLRGARSLDEALSMIAHRAAKLSPGEWLQGGRWDKNQWPDDRATSRKRLRRGGDFPTKEALDTVVPQNPAFLKSKDGHSAWVNSAALDIAGITAETATPPGGAILRDSTTGEPTGVLQESASGLVRRHIPEPTLPRIREAIRDGMRAANALGVTGIHNIEGPDVFEAFQLLESDSELTLRVVSYLPRASLDDAVALGLRSGFGGAWHRLGGVKLMLDGALGSQTAAMLEPFEGSDNAGLLEMSEDELCELACKASENGLNIAVHAIGDRANHILVNVLERLAQEGIGVGVRHRVEHAQHLAAEDVHRFGRLGLIASMQPVHLYDDIAIAERRLGGRSAGMFLFRSLLRAGARLCFGSDAPVESIDPLAGLHAAVARQRRDGTPPEGWHPEERLGMMEALHAYTAAAAHAGGNETIAGSIEPGKLADFAVLSHDVTALPADELRQARVEMTVVDGETVYDAGSSK